MKPKVLGVIPARLGSTRLKRKMLAEIAGQPLIFYTWKQALKAKELDAVLIATDSREIFKVAKNFGAEVVMTSSNLNSGTERVAEALKKFKKFSPDIVVNIQGDEPLISAAAIDLSINELIKDRKILIATPATSLVSQINLNSPNFVKVVTDERNNALYFSRSILPYPRASFRNFFKHIGLYAFRKDFLLKYVKLPATDLERAEKLEQLRILEHGYPIKVVKGKFRNLEVNTQQEFFTVKRIIEKSLR